MAPTYLSKCFKYVHEVQPYNTRMASDNKLVVPRPHTSMFKNSFQYAGTFVWNSIPNDVKQCTTVSNFKNKLKSFILSK